MPTQREREALRRLEGEKPPVPPGHWLIAGTPITEPYPCDCGEEQHFRRPPSEWCFCYGRTDLENVGDGCCAARFLAHPAWAEDVKRRQAASAAKRAREWRS